MSSILTNKVDQVTLDLEPVKVNLIPVGASQLDDLVGITYKNMPIGRLVVSELTDRYNDIYLSLADLESNQPGLLLGLFNTAISLYEKSFELYKGLKPDLVYVWNGRRFNDGPLIYAAEALNINYQVFISGSYKRYVAYKGRSVQDLGLINELVSKFRFSHQLTNDDRITSEAYYDVVRGLKEPPEGVAKSAGHAAFNKYSAEKISLLNKDKFVLILTSSNWEVFGLPVWSDTPFRDQYKTLKILLEDSAMAEVNFRVRWHPAHASSGVNEMKAIKNLINDTSSSRVIHYDFKSKINTFDLIDSAEKVIVFGSTTAMYAVNKNKPVILLGRANYECFDGCYMPESFERARALIQTKQLIPKSREASIYYANYYSRPVGNPYSFLEIDKSSAFSYKGVPLTMPRNIFFRKILAIYKSNKLIFANFFKRLWA
jgi:hypothetical protein